ncbi:hypothetical protein [Paraburkholderia unamae]|uniref:HdeA/HdeB family protein n=1 Tax=Paraburkholderia unamae TaxID=219649 RepID=A0ABX5KHD3_9BURK|nr:hypothetical protein [Paraburkholderia unamae]PVX77048.1 hypothetical protein C7402_115107 [Paraburkholderia unamae]CAG9261577.1 conserved exported hypothetical protein [Paraburkholderia unamae]
MNLRCFTLVACACFAFAVPLARADDDAPKSPAPASGYNYPTQGRVEYVLGCMDDNGHDFANVYKCSCVIDKMAAVLPYDEFVDQSTFAKYATLGGEGGSEFRVDRAKAQAKRFRTLQTEAYRSCGLGKDKTASAP